MTYLADPTRDESAHFRRTDRSGLDLPAVSLGLWHKLRGRHAAGDPAGDPAPGLRPRRHPRRPGQQLRPALRWRRGEPRHDLRAGPPALPRRARALHEGRLRHVAGPVRAGRRLAHVPAVEPRPVAAPHGRRLALDTAVRSGRALYAGISSYSAERTREAVAILRDLGTPLLIHQPSYSMLNRWIEEDLLDVLGEEGVGCIAFSPLAQGMLTSVLPRRPAVSPAVTPMRTHSGTLAV